MKRRIDITGGQYGRLFALKEVEPKKYHRRWLCRCECGNEKIVNMNSLRNGHTQSCGCLQREKSSVTNSSNLVGKVFGKLTVIERMNTDSKSRKVRWKCICFCGNESQAFSDNLLNGSVQSCGCLRGEKGKILQSYNKKNLFVDGVYVPLLKSKLRSDNSTGIKGVYTVKQNNSIKYKVRIGIKNKKIYLGTYSTIEEAEKIRKLGEKRFHNPYLEN